MKIRNLVKFSAIALLAGMLIFAEPASATKRSILHQAVRSEAIYQTRKAMRTAAISAAATDATIKTAKKTKKYTDTSTVYKKAKTKAKAAATATKNYTKKAYNAVKKSMTDSDNK